MFFDVTLDSGFGDALVEQRGRARWGVDSEYGRLTDVLLSSPRFLEMLPANSVTCESLANGLACCTDTASRQHDALIAALERQGVRCHVAPARSDLVDLSFMRDAALMTPWGLVELNLAAAHRAAEAPHVAAAASAFGVPHLGAIREGTVEGGDVCILRPGIVIIGHSGERTTETGARSLADLFETRGWEVIHYGFDPQFLHLDTQFTLVGRNEAVACVDVLTPSFLDRVAKLGIDLIPASGDELRCLGANLLCLGERLVVSPSDNGRINIELAKRGYEVIDVDLDQFTRCGGGVHCLTLPLTREPG